MKIFIELDANVFELNPLTSALGQCNKQKTAQLFILGHPTTSIEFKETIQ